MQASVLRNQIESALAARFPSALTVRERPMPQTLSTGIAAVDNLAGGLPRGALTEVVGASSSGRTSLLLATLAHATSKDEVCALVDAGDAFSPHSAQDAGVALERLLWIRCSATGRNCEWRRTEQALKVTDLLLQSGGFGLVAVDLGETPPKIARRVPLTSWFRFRRAVESTQTVLLVIEQQANAKTCASLVLEMKLFQPELSAISFQSSAKAERPAHARLLSGFSIEIEMTRAQALRKPVQSATSFATHCAEAYSR